MNYLKKSFYIPLAIIVFLSGFLGNFVQDRHEYAAVQRLNQIQQQSESNLVYQQNMKE